MTYPIVRWCPALDLDAFARRCDLRPELVHRLVALGLLDAERAAAGRLWLAPTQLPAVARIQRLRAGFALNYAAVGLVVDLLDRIAELETALRARPDRPAALSRPTDRASQPTNRNGDPRCWKH